jgi:GrpB-like predicted nucleotidyltransferase (UPF0157 family)
MAGPKFDSPQQEYSDPHYHSKASGPWVDDLAFRDLLATDAALASDYAALKHRLAAAYRDDRERYTAEKGPFIESTLRRTRGTQ